MLSLPADPDLEHVVTHSPPAGWCFLLLHSDSAGGRGGPGYRWTSRPVGYWARSVIDDTVHQIRGYEAHFRLCEFGTTLRPFWTNNDCLELFLTVWDHLGPFGTILDHFGQFWTILVRFHHIDPLGPKWLKWSKRGSKPKI